MRVSLCKTLIEGDARLYELLFANDLLGLGYTQSNTVSVSDRYLQTDSERLDGFDSSFFATRVLIYSLGSRYEAVEYDAGGNAAIRNGYATEPRRTLELLTATGSPAERGRAAPESSLPSAATVGMDVSVPPPSEVVQALTATGELALDASENRLLITATNFQSPLTWTPAMQCP